MTSSLGISRRTLGTGGPMVSAIGLGCMGMSGAYGPSDRVESIATIHAALDAGVTLIDTGDFYGMGHNELLIAEAVRGIPRDSYQLSVKFNALRSADGTFLGFDSRPQAVQNFLVYSLQRLGVDYIDIYRPSRLDRDVPIEETVGALADLVGAGRVRHIGLSEIGTDTLRRAVTVHPICDLQIEYSLISRGIEESILPAARELGVGITAYGVLARGLISGHWSRDGSGKGDARALSPRFQQGNVEANLDLVEALRTIAATRGATVAQAAIAWVMHRGADIVPIVGSRRRDQLAEAMGSAATVLSADDVAMIEATFPKGVAAGERYPSALMSTLDSER